MKDLQDRLRSLPPAQRQKFLDEIRKRKEANQSAAPQQRISRRPADIVPPLSSAQEQMWLINQLEPSSFVLPFTLRLSGDLNVRALRKSVEQIVERHEILRTTAPDVGGAPVQSVSPALAEAQWHHVDVSSEPDPERRIFETVSSKVSFDLRLDPPFRVLLFKVGADEHALVLLFHHIAIDEWGFGIFLDEFAAIYSALASGEMPSLDPVQVQSADYAVWERARLAEAGFDDIASWWGETLEGAPNQLSWPGSDDGAVDENLHTMAGCEFDIDEAAAARLNELSREYRTTPMVPYLAALAAAVSVTSGQRSLVIGVPVATRDRPELSNSLGMLLNTLPIRVDVLEADDFRSLLQRVRDTWHEAVSRKSVPLGHIVNRLGDRPRGAHIAPFDIMFTSHPVGGAPPRFGSLAVELVPNELTSSYYSLIVSAQLGSGASRLSCKFAQDAFDSWGTSLLTETLQTVLQQAAEGSPPLLERRALLDEATISELERRESRWTPARLRERLLELLPAGAVPERVIFLDELPRLPSGKIDRASLPSASAAEFIAPMKGAPARTETERRIAALWGKHLGVENPGVDASFFDLGGHSLMVVSLQSDLQSEFEVTLALRDIFKAPTIAGLASLIESCSKDDGGGRIEARAHGGDVPVSSDQLRMWVLQSLHPKSPAYNVPFVLRLRGELNLEALKGALRDITARHEILRTIYPEVDGEPVQRIIPAAAQINTSVEDLRDQSDPEEAVGGVVARAAGRPFDLGVEPSLRVTVAQLGARDHVLILLIHHIAIDEWSTAILAGEIAELYTAASEQRSPRLTPPALQYADYAVWQRKRLAGPALQESLSFWVDHLDDAPASIEWPIGREDAAQTGSSDVVEVQLEHHLTDAFGDIARAHGCTLFPVLHAAFAAFLARFTGASDVTIGLPVSSRDRPELQGLVGLLLNTLPVRSRVAASLSFREWVGLSNANWRATEPHRWVPFDEIVRVLGASGDEGSAALFDVMLTYVPGRGEGIGFGNLDAEWVDADLSDAKASLAASFIGEGDALRCAFEFDAGKFSRSSIEGFAEQFTRFIARCVVAPDLAMGSHQLLSTTEEAIVAKWSLGETLHIAPRLPHRLFEAQAERVPDAVALLSDSESWSYAELNERANRIARRLIAVGVQEGSIVGVSMHRSPALVAALFGVAKAGAAFVALEPSLPSERISSIIEDAGVNLSIVDEAGRAVLGERTKLLDVESAMDEGVSSENLEHACDPESLAYVLYTSGTTGRPKGVMTPHRAVASHAVGFARAICNLDEAEAARRVFFVKASYTFDLFVSELYVPLVAGARVVLAPVGSESDPDQLWRALCEHGVTDLWSTPTTLRMMELAMTSQVAESIEFVYSAGEALSSEFCSVLHQWGVTVWNLYGPTEMCAGQVGNIVTPAHCRDESLAIGRAAPNHGAHIVDRGLSRRDVGVDGEIVLTGDGEAHGYLGMPRRAAEVFVPSDLVSARGARMYRTGDIGRWLEDGRIAYRGRRDAQLQIRGVRVELEDVEAHLASAPGIKQAAVRPVNPRDSRADSLVAYVVLESAAALDDATLRQYLAERLPEPVIPSRFMRLETMPVTRSGKVDRKALPDPSELQGGEPTATPRTPTEHRVLEIWSALLERATLGIHDRFFSVGGHSLLAIRLQRALLDEFDVRVALDVLFRFDTIAKLAAFLDRVVERRVPQAELDGDSTIVTLREGSSENPLILVHPIGGDLLAYRSLVDALDEGRAVLGVRVCDRASTGDATIPQLGAYYVEALRDHIDFERCEIAGWSFGGVVAFEMTRRLLEDGVGVNHLYLLDSWSPDEFRSAAEAASLEPIEEFALDLIATLGLPVERLLEARSRLANLREGSRFDWLSEQLRAESGGAFVIEPEALEERFALFVQHRSAYVKFAPDPIEVDASIVASSEGSGPPHRGWEGLVQGHLRTEVVDGSHHSILRLPAVARVAELMNG